jgi:FkbM family methyltransferase
MTETRQEPNRMGRRAALWRRLAYRLLAHHAVLRRVRATDGEFDAFLMAGSRLAILRPSGVLIEATHRRFIDRWVTPRSIVWDIGGNMGLFAFPAALRARYGHVYVFEPDTELASNLLRSLRRSRNRSLPVTVMPLALSDRDGVAAFEISAYGRAMNKLEGVGDWHSDLFVAAETRQVPTFRIDTVAETCRPPDIVKIDVEGAEIRVLNGARKTIAAHRPVMTIEAPKELQSEIGAFLAEHDYVVLDGGADDFPPLPAPGWDTVAVPREKWLAGAS